MTKKIVSKTKPKAKAVAPVKKATKQVKKVVKKNVPAKKRPDMVGNKYAVGADSGRPREWTNEEIEKETVALNKWIENPKNYFITGFLAERHLDTAHLDRFSKYSEEFRLAYAHAKVIQEARLVELGVSRKGDGNFIKFVLQNKSGWKEKSEVSGDASNPLAVIMDRIALTARDPLDDYDFE